VTTVDLRVLRYVTCLADELHFGRAARACHISAQPFGQAGQADVPSVTRPRFQAGVRYRPNEIFSVDLIYGRNIQGENANWITLGTTIRFPPPESRPARQRTGHL